MARVRSDKSKDRIGLTQRYLADIFDSHVATGAVSVLHLAAMVGVTRAQIYNWAKGRSEPSDENFQNLLLVIANLSSNE